MNNVTREKREILFFRENESALLNRLGPGPAKYQCYNKGASSRHTYSIPRATRNIGIDESKVAKPKKSPARVAPFASAHAYGGTRVPISHCSPKAHLEIRCKKGASATFGGYRQRFDIAKANAVNSSLWKKGILF